MESLHEVFNILEQAEKFCTQMEIKGPKGKYHYEMLMRSIKESKKHVIGVWNHANIAPLKGGRAPGVCHEDSPDARTG